MGKSEQIRERERMTQFFRNLLSDEAGLSSGERERLAVKLARPINLLMVWEFPDPAPAVGQPATETGAETGVTYRDLQARQDSETAAPKPDTSLSSPGDQSLADMAPWPEPDQDEAERDDSGAEAPKPSAAFNPYSFNAVVVFKREGADALMAQLENIGSVENLKRLAAAQHLAVPRGIDALDDLRDAIVKGAAQRLADRQAAGS